MTAQTAPKLAAPDIEPADYQELVSYVQSRREGSDRSAREVGDAVSKRVKQIRRGGKLAFLQGLAAETGYTRAGLREVVDCATFWAGMWRWDDCPTIFWAHYNRARRCGDLETACDWMEQAASGAWSVADLSRNMGEAGKKEPDILADSIQRALRAVARALEVRPMAQPVMARLREAQDALTTAQQRL